MAGLDRTFGIAVPNFTAYPQMPDVKALVEYGVRMEHLGFDSLWVWDHILLGVEAIDMPATPMRVWETIERAKAGAAAAAE